MWVFLSDSFLSIVQSGESSEYLMVRAMRECDIQVVFGDEYEVVEETGHHYKYRAEIPRSVVTNVLAMEIEDIDYFHFQETVRNPLRQKAFARVSKAITQYKLDELVEWHPRPEDLLKKSPWHGVFNPFGRLILAVAGFHRKYDIWPTKIMMSTEALRAIRLHYLTQLGYRELRIKLRIVTVSEETMIAADDEGRFHLYDALGEGADLAEKWLGYA